MLKNTILTSLLLIAGGPTIEPTSPASRVAETTSIAPVSAPIAPLPELTDRQLELVEWAQGRFAAAGLELPPATVRFDPTRELCHRHLGLFEHDERGYVITICTVDRETFAADLAARRTLLHEFAHVWDDAHLTDDDRDELLDLFGLEAWLDGDDDWADRGIEFFAEVVVFGLLDQPRRSLEIEIECPAAAAAFEHIAGVPPIGPGVPWCVGTEAPAA